MRKVQLGIIAVLLSFVAPAIGQQPTLASGSFGTPEGRTFFPHNWVRGYTDIEFAPPHNEPDLGRCQMPANQFGGARAPCTAFARYMLSAYIELEPIGRGLLRHVFLFYTPRFSFGQNVPQFSYTGSFAPMAYDRGLGVGIELPKNFEFRVVQHQVDWLGRYRNNLGAADLHTTGPYGLYSTIGLRWHFGGWGRAHVAQ